MTAPGGNGAGLRVAGLTRRFPGSAAPAVDDVSFDVGPGELLALVGASGSGKTTTLRMIAGFELPDAGEITLDGPDGRARQITRDPPQKRGFGMVFQHYALFPHMSVAENVAFGLEARGISKAERRTRAVTSLDRVGLAAAADRSVQSLSGGEQQRVALARALVIEPRVLLLDEPLSNLDPTLRSGMREELRRMLRSLGITAVFVTHDQEDAFAIADRVAMLERGRLQQVGSPEALYETPSSASVARFIGRGALLPAHREGDAVVVAIGGSEQRTRAASTSATNSTASPRAAGLAVLRPEALAFTDVAQGWPGTVIGRRFAGGHFAYLVTLDAHQNQDDPPLEITSSDGTVREGQRVGLRLIAPTIAFVPA